MTSQPKPERCAERCCHGLEPGSVLVLKFQPQPALWRSASGVGSSSFAAPSPSFATTWATAAIPARVSLSLGRSGPRNAAGGISPSCRNVSASGGVVPAHEWHTPQPPSGREPAAPGRSSIGGRWISSPDRWAAGCPLGRLSRSRRPHDLPDRFLRDELFRLEL